MTYFVLGGTQKP